VLCPFLVPLASVASSVLLGDDLNLEDSSVLAEVFEGLLPLLLGGERDPLALRVNVLEEVRLEERLGVEERGNLAHELLERGAALREGEPSNLLTNVNFE